MKCFVCWPMCKGRSFKFDLYIFLLVPFIILYCKPGVSGEPLAGPNKDEVSGAQKRTKAVKQRHKETSSQHVHSDATSVRRCNYDHNQQSKLVASFVYIELDHFSH